MIGEFGAIVVPIDSKRFIYRGFVVFLPQMTQMGTYFSPQITRMAQMGANLLVGNIVIVGF